MQYLSGSISRLRNPQDNLRNAGPYDQRRKLENSNVKFISSSQTGNARALYVHCFLMIPEIKHEMQSASVHQQFWKIK
jgi:hypothetical protein